MWPPRASIFAAVAVFLTVTTHFARAQNSPRRPTTQSAAFASSRGRFAARVSVGRLRRSSSVAMSTTNKNKPLRGPEAQPPRPNDCTYWVTGNLIVGEYPADNRGEDETWRKIRCYLDRGVTVFVDLTHRGEKAQYEGVLREEAVRRGMEEADISYVRMPVRDFGVPDDKARMTEILDAIDGAAEEGRTAYVHCRGGIGRTGTVVGCYLVRHGNSGQEALNEVNRLFRYSDRRHESSCSPETVEQMNFVRNWVE